MNDSFGSSDPYAVNTMLDVAKAREAPGKSNSGRAFTAEQTALIRKYREYIMGTAYSPEHQAEIEQVIATVEAQELFGPNEIVTAMRGLYRAARGGFIIRMVEINDHKHIEVSKVVTSPWGLYDLGDCD